MQKRCKKVIAWPKRLFTWLAAWELSYVWWTGDYAVPICWVAPLFLACYYHSMKEKKRKTYLLLILPERISCSYLKQRWIIRQYQMYCYKFLDCLLNIHQNHQRIHFCLECSSSFTEATSHLCPQQFVISYHNKNNPVCDHSTCQRFHSYYYQQHSWWLWVNRRSNCRVVCVLWKPSKIFYSYACISCTHMYKLEV